MNTSCCLNRNILISRTGYASVLALGQSTGKSLMSGQNSDMILIIGLGSPIMSDDAIGLVVSEEIGSMKLRGVKTCQESIGGLDIIPVLCGHKYAIIVDAIKTGLYEPGTVIVFDLENFEPTVVASSAHDVNLATAIKIGRALEPEGMPLSVKFVAIEVEDIQTVSESLTPKVLASVKNATSTVVRIVNEFMAESKNQVDLC
ncbi:MAG: hydrogenase maturation protease [archaeon]|nr:hydrogenase maturation protease [archaeon]